MSPELRAAVDLELSAGAGGSRKAGARSLSDTYRAGGHSAGIDLAAYVTVRLPATYAAVDRVLTEMVALRPDLAPVSLVDAGSGPGTAAWTAVNHWPGLSRITFVDNDRTFLDLALRLAGNGNQALARAEGRVASLERLPEGLAGDLVISAYALAELPEARAAAAARHLWSRADAAVVLVEPGTPAGFARIRAARHALLAEGAVPVGPCPHTGACPMTGGDWCHFSVRLARSRAHMHAKAAAVPFEDEKFCWIAMARSGAPSGGARVLAPVRHGKAGIDMTLCTTDGMALRHVARRDAAAYRAVRKSDWGDLI